MTYTYILLIFGLIPLFAIWIARQRLIWRYKGSLFVIVILIVMVSVPWEMASVRRIWYYSPGAILGIRFWACRSKSLPFSSSLGCWSDRSRCFWKEVRVISIDFLRHLTYLVMEATIIGSVAFVLWAFHLRYLWALPAGVFVPLELFDALVRR